MDIQKNRLAIASVALIALAGGLYLSVKKRDETLSGTSSAAPSIPAITADAIKEIAITRPGQPTIKLTKQGDVFRVTSPVQSATDASVVGTAIEKLTALEVVNVAATNASNHAVLEVDDAHAVHVLVSGASGPIADLRIGAFRGGNTMVRVGTSNDVLAVEGSIKFAFNRELKEWRDRAVVDVDADDVRIVSIASDVGTYRFERNATDEWTPAAGQPAIERFSAAKVEAIAAALGHLRANDFAEGSAQNGLATPRSTVTLTVRTGGGGDAGAATTEEIVLLLGGTVADSTDAYVQRRGNPLVYTVASFVSTKMRPEIADLQEPVPSDAGTPPAPPEMPQMGGPGGGQIPPELLEQLQRQMGGGHP